MKLGINLSHNSSAALVEENGKVIAAIEEERITRVKNHVGIPVRSIETLLTSEYAKNQISEIIVGSHQLLNRAQANQFLINTYDHPSIEQGHWSKIPPGFQFSNLRMHSHQIIENYICKLMEKCHQNQVKVTWINHHDSHIGTSLSLVSNTSEKNLLISLDGEGDGESGVIAIASGRDYLQRLVATRDIDSIGNLYSAVTARYGFKPNRHEGKITGLAAFGKNSMAVQTLLKYVEITQGRISIAQEIKKHNLNSRVNEILADIVDMAESQTENYADLAFAIQKVLEKSVIEILQYWIKVTGSENLHLSGGVFSNVRLNQAIVENTSAKNVKIFPNMTDGGISLGAVWTSLAKSKKLEKLEPLFTSMYLAPKEDSNEFMIENYSDLKMEKIDLLMLARAIASSKFVATHRGRMEFGPRALGNRSLLLDARNSKICELANAKLRRTDFMPFAPVVREEDFNEYFNARNGDLTSYYYMTITCKVREEYRTMLPGITHHDGTARPQIVSQESNPFIHQLLSAYKNISGVGILVNTSLNLHEFPINYRLEDSISMLQSGVLDILVTDNHQITKLAVF